MAHFGSIHSGRYANYAIFIAEHDRVPLIAQNLGQSMLAGFHLLLGIDAPLAALMVWIPFALTALSSLLFGYFRGQGLSPGQSRTGAYFVLCCNIAISLVSVLVLDNGSPLGFAGYTDVIAGAATFLLFAKWFERVIHSRDRVTPWAPLLLGVFWCWTAPQNLVVGAVAGVGVSLISLVAWPAQRIELLRRLALCGTMFALSVAAGASQLGALLPKSWQENIGEEVFLVDSRLSLRPFVMYVSTHWTDSKRNRPACFSPDAYEATDIYLRDYREARYRGWAAVVARWIATFETEVWTSVRLFGFPWLALVLMGWRLNRSQTACEAKSENLKIWF
jgi:hypothetical protein